MPSARRLPWLALSLCTVTALVALIYPLYVIRPFRAQGAAELALALVVRRYGPLSATVAALLALLPALALWRSASSRLARAASTAVAGLTLLAAGLSHINVYEIMFHPAGRPEFTPAANAPVDPDDMVLSVSLPAGAHAYPIRTMGYHHIANDWIGNTPIAATY